jgi:hypothetical protein
VDWDDDRLVLRRALEFAVGRARAAGQDLGATKRQLEEAAASIASAGDGAKLQIEAGRLDRAFSIVSKLDQTQHLAKEVLDLLLRHPLIVEQVTVAVNAERVSMRNQIQQELTAEHKALAETQRARGEVEAQIGVLRQELATLRATREQDVAAIEQAVAERIEEVLRRPETLLAETAVLRTVIGGVRGERRRSPLSQEAPPIRPWRQGKLLVTELTDLRKRLVASLKARGASPALSQPLHAAFTAPQAPILAGPHSLAALSAYADVVTGGRVVVVQATASLVEPGDIFGKVDPQLARFTPHPGALLDTLEAARQSDGLVLVIIEGVNRGPTESYLLALLRNAMGRGPAVPVFHPQAVSGEDAYRYAARVEWPRNALLAATVVEGPTTLPIAMDVWSDALLVQTDVAGGDPELRGDRQVELSEVPLGSELLRTPAENDTFLDSFIDVPEFSQYLGCVRRFTAALQRFTSDADTIRTEVVRAIVVPFLASTPGDVLVQQLAPCVSVTPDDLRALAEHARTRVG